jgi:hypothetical protein
MDDKEIMSRISELIGTEHELRGQLQRGELTSEQERERLRSTEEALDQCWDLLRQRRAKREFGESPEGAAARPVSEVEGYQQLSTAGTALRPLRIRPRRFSVRFRASRLESDKRAKEHRAYREVRQGRRRGVWRRRG